jgi:ABC-type amino acid transport substrate-binding protein
MAAARIIEEGDTMRFTRSLNFRGHRSGIATLATAMLALSFLLPAAVPAAAGTLDRVREAGKVRFGYYPEAQPFCYRDASGKAAGYAVALCESIAVDIKAALGLPALGVEFVPVTGPERFDALQQGRIDLLCLPTVANLAFREKVAFSIPIFPGGIWALLRADAPARLREVLAGREAPNRPAWRGAPGLDALQKRTFSAVAGTTNLTWLTKKLDELKVVAEVVPVESFDVGVKRVLDRSTDVLFGERAVLLDAAKRNASAGDLVVIDRLFTYDPLALALERGDEDFRLLVDRSLSRLYRSGGILALYLQYFGEPDENALMFFRLSAVPE